MAREQQEICTFTTQPTPDVAERSVVLSVPEKFFKDSTTVALGTTLQAFLPGQDKAGALNRGYGDYLLSDTENVEGGLLAFTFAKPKTSEQKATAFRTTIDIEASVYWPPVLRGLTWTPILRYQSAGGGSTYVERYNWDIDMRDAYDGPTVVTTTEYLSPEPFVIAVPEILRPEGFTFDYVLGELTIPRCLHGAFNFSFSTGTTNYLYPYTISEKSVLATNAVDWPPTLVISDTQKRVNGVWWRTTVTASRPILI
jgi:hypothetical protein